MNDREHIQRATAFTTSVHTLVLTVIARPLVFCTAISCVLHCFDISSAHFRGARLSDAEVHVGDGLIIMTSVFMNTYYI